MSLVSSSRLLDQSGRIQRVKRSFQGPLTVYYVRNGLAFRIGATNVSQTRFIALEVQWVELVV